MTRPHDAWLLFRWLLAVACSGWLCVQPLGCTKANAPETNKVSHSERLVIHEVALRSMTGRDPALLQTVVIEGEHITEITAAQRFERRPGDRLIEGDSAFLMPGLSDMHSHASTSQEMARYLAHGVTTLRIMSGETTHLQHRDAVQSGARIGPTLIVASPIIDGDPPTRSELVIAKNADHIRQHVRDFHESGFDQIKLYHLLGSDLVEAATETAHALGLMVVGHAPLAVPPEDIYRTGYHSMEHLTGMLRAAQDAPVAFSAAPSSTEWSLRSGAAADPNLVGPLASSARDEGVWLVPTLRMHRILQASPEQWEVWSADERTAQVSGGARAVWQRELADRQNVSAELYASSDVAWQNLLAITWEAHRAGARLLVGTDYGMPHLFAGEAVHQEIAAFVEAGLSPESALLAATAHAAEFLEQAGTFGTVQVGARADLVLLARDPLQDVNALQSIEGVLVRGHYFDRKALDEMLEDGVIPGQVAQTQPAQICHVQATGAVASIETFDDRDAFISGDRRRGMWYAFDDGSSGTQTPTQAAWILADGGLTAAGAALRVEGGGYTIWGAGVGVSFAWDDDLAHACAYDASVWDGISFWAKGNVSGLAVALPQLDVLPVEEGGRCVSDCYFAHQATVQLDACWRQYAFGFNELELPAWSSQSGALNEAEVTGLQFLAYNNTAPDNRFEYWVDQIEFFQGDPPSSEPLCPDQGAGGAGGAGGSQ